VLAALSLFSFKFFWFGFWFVIPAYHQPTKYSRNAYKFVCLFVCLYSRLVFGPRGLFGVSRRRGPRGLPSPRIFMFLGVMKTASNLYRPTPQDLGVRGASIMQTWTLVPSLVGLSSDLYHLCRSAVPVMV